MVRKAIVVAEIGCNHMGKEGMAMQLIEAAATCGAHYAKFQKRCIQELFTRTEYQKPHPAPCNAFGSSYGKHREHLEFDISVHQRLLQHCQKNGIKYACSVWDTTSAKEISSLTPNPDYIKIPSAMNLCWPIYDTLLESFSGQIHVSLGMTSKQQQQQIVDYFTQRMCEDRLVPYHCTSNYPTDFEDICLLEIDRLMKLYDFPIGFSGHHKGIAIDIAAFAFGAKYIERHFTLDRTYKGTDHAASLEPGGLEKLVRDLEATEKSLQYKDKILDCEQESLKKLKKTKLNSIIEVNIIQ